MESPLSVPDVASIYDEISERPSRSFDALDFCYSEDVSTGSSPIAGQIVSFIPTSAEGAPSFPESASEDNETHEDNTSIRHFGRKGQRPSLLEEERMSVVVDYDVSDEEDDLVYTSYDTAPTSNLQLQSEGADDRSDSLSEFVATSPVVTSVSKSIQDSSDFVVSSLEPVSPLRRVSSTPIIWDRQKAGASTPPLGPGRKQNPPPRRSQSMSISTPYAFPRHSSLPITSRTVPAILFKDDSQAQGKPKDRNRGASIFRAGRSGTPTSPCSRPPPSKGTILRSPLARKYRFEDSLPSPKRISSPYAFRRQMSLPITADERRSEPAIWFAVDSEPLVVGERSRKNRNRGSGMFRGGRPETPTSVASKGSRDSEKWVVTLHENLSSNTDDDGFDEELGINSMSGAVEEGSQKALMDDVDYNVGSSSEPSTRSKGAKALFQRQKMLYVLYLSAFSIFGSTVRVFLGRFFGSNCETSDIKLDEFCVTADGQTIQRGGALFIDLPANMVGCFIMGLVTSLKPGVWPPLPWFRHDHPLQQHDAYHVGIRTGLCGSITTFSSWNAQMIVMMDGTGTQLGSQIVPALFGYAIGFCCSVSSFLLGTHVSIWLNRLKNPEIAHEDDEELRLNTVESINHEEDSLRRRHMSAMEPTPPQRIVVFPQFLSSENRFCRHFRAFFCSGRMPFVILIVLLATYAIGGFAKDDTFLRTMFFSSIFTPPGALLRWELYKWNTRISSQRSRRMNWLPWGTFVANTLGASVCILLVALQMRYNDDAVNNIWAVSLLTALRTGFCGSLSTVSTMVKEMYELNSKFPYHAKAYHYATFTVVSSIVLGLCLYSPIVRSH